MKNTWKRLGIISASIIGGAYVLFLASPLIINPIIKGFVPTIETEINKASGLVSKLEGVKVVTTPKLTAGLKVDDFELKTPDNEPILSAEDFQVKMSLLPLLKKQIRVDMVGLEDIEANIRFNKDGSLYIEKYLPVTNPTTTEPVAETSTTNNLPLKLSNHLPDIRIGGYDITLTDGVNKYTLSGDRTDITDFIINKSIKIEASGKMTLRDREQFNYNLKVLNKIMPDIELNDLVFAEPAPKTGAKKEAEPVDVIGILDGIYKSNLTANADADLVITPDGIKGFANATNISLINLPKSSAMLKFKGNTIDIKSDIYTAQTEVSNIMGNIKTGKNPKIDMSFKSDVEIANILRIIKEIALIFNIKDLQTITANGKFNADFNIKSDMKKVQSNGYLKVPSADLYYGLYKIGIDDINADVRLDNNNININNIGFSVLNQPLKFFGSIKEDGTSDLHLVADKLGIKGLLIAVGQAPLLKENNVNSGTITLNADITGKLDKINPVIKITTDNVNIKNIPSDTALIAPLSIVNITSDGKTFMGNAISNNIKVVNPAATVTVPSLKANIREKEIEITETPVKIDKINTNVSGKISNYLTEKIGLNFTSTGDIKSALTGDMNVVKQTLNLNYSTTSPSTIIIPMFDKSNMTFTGNIDILGSMMNPILKGSVNIPTLSIPEIPVTMTNLDIKLNGPIAIGSGSVQKFTSGGIEAENITSDFQLKGNDFYLNNMKGTTFGGKFQGNIIYNLANTKTTIDFSGEGLNAEHAVHGAVGIKNALTGTLGFNTKLTLLVKDYEEMMRSLKGNLKFSVTNGSFGSIGRLENFFNASNIVSNTLLKTTVATLTSGIGLAETAKYDAINGSLTFANGWANINTITSSAPLMTYYITGKYNLVNGTTNVVILGRLDASVVAKLGVVGELSADKLFGYIPKFGSLTANIVNALTANPKGENIAAIPALTNGSTNYKDFKVTFNGGLESTSSVKSFKWLTEVDTSAIETKSVKETLNDIKTSVGTDYKNTIKSVTDAVSGSKEQWNTTRDQFKNSANELLNLFK